MKENATWRLDLGVLTSYNRNSNMNEQRRWEEIQKQQKKIP